MASIVIPHAFRVYRPVIFGRARSRGYPLPGVASRETGDQNAGQSSLRRVRLGRWPAGSLGPQSNRVPAADAQIVFDMGVPRYPEAAVLRRLSSSFAHILPAKRGMRGLV